jgi:hypothetical protein
LRHSTAWVASFAFIVDAQWYVYLLGPHRQDLRIGYFLWWSSFLLLFLGYSFLLGLTRGNRVNHALLQRICHREVPLYFLAVLVEPSQIHDCVRCDFFWTGHTYLAAGGCS